ncbi:MAG: HAMP domain-containing protein [Myxococcota bacterium]
MRLWVRLTLAMAVLAVVPVVLVGLSAIEIATRRAEESSVERLRREATLHAELVDRWVHDQAPLVLGFPQLYAGRFGELSSEAQQKFPRMVYRLMPSAVTVVLVDGTGAAVVDPTYSTEPGGERTPSSPARARELIERLPLAAVLAEPSVVHTGAAWLPAGTGSRPSLPVAVLAAGGPTPADQRILGVEVALEITDHLASASSDRHAVALLDAAGSALVGGGPLVEPDRLRALLGTDQRIDFRLDADTAAGEIRGSVAPVGATGWSVVVAEPASVVLAPAVEIRRRMLPQLALAIGSAIVLALLVASSLSRPVELLRDATLELAAGRLGVHAHVRRSDEIGDLARAFDHMSDRLETSRREIADQQGEHDRGVQP